MKHKREWPDKAAAPYTLVNITDRVAERLTPRREASLCNFYGGDDRWRIFDALRRRLHFVVVDGLVREISLQNREPIPEDRDLLRSCRRGKVNYVAPSSSPSLAEVIQFPLKVVLRGTGKVEAIDTLDDVIYDWENFSSSDDAEIVVDAMGRAVVLVVEWMGNNIEFRLAHKPTDFVL